MERWVANIYTKIFSVFFLYKSNCLYYSYKRETRNIELKTKAKQKNRERRQVTNICRFMNIKLRGARCLQSENNPLCFKTSFVRSVTVYISHGLNRFYPVKLRQFPNVFLFLFLHVPTYYQFPRICSLNFLVQTWTRPSRW